MKQSYLFDFQRDKNFNLGKNISFYNVTCNIRNIRNIRNKNVIKNVTNVTYVTPKNVTLSLYFYLRALKKNLTPWKKKLTPWKKNLRASSRHFQGS